MTIVKLQTQVTLDGYLAGPAGEMDWMSPSSADMGAHVGALMAPVRHLSSGADSPRASSRTGRPGRITNPTRRPTS